MSEGTNSTSVVTLSGLPSITIVSKLIEMELSVDIIEKLLELSIKRVIVISKRIKVPSSTLKYYGVMGFTGFQMDFF